MIGQTRTTLGKDIEQALGELAAHVRSRLPVESYEIDDSSADSLTPARVQAIRRRVASSTKDFERQFHISARTMEAYEQGRRRPAAAVRTLLRVIEREPDAVRRALGDRTARAV